MNRRSTSRLRIAFAITFLFCSVNLGVKASGPIAYRPIIFSQAQRGSPQIFSIDSDGSHLKALTPSTIHEADHPELSPSGELITFDAYADLGYSINVVGVYVMKVDGTNLKRLTSDQINASFPVWSPDGKRILFQCDAGICLMNADGSSVSVLTHNPHSGDGAWSHDGKKIVFTSDTGLYTINADGSKENQLLAGNTYAEPAWSADDKLIAFDVNSGERSDIYILNSVGSGLTDLTKDMPRGGMSPVWSPNGDNIVFYDQINLVFIRSVAAKPQIIVWNGNIGGYLFYPVWSPDSTQVAFVSQRDDSSKSGIFIVRIGCVLSSGECTGPDLKEFTTVLEPSYGALNYASHLNWAYSPVSNQ